MFGKKVGILLSPQRGKRDAIKNYINDRISGNLLLDNDNKQYTSSNLSIHIMRIFSKIYDISISAVELRHYYSTYINYLVKYAI